MKHNIQSQIRGMHSAQQTKMSTINATLLSRAELFELKSDREHKTQQTELMPKFVK